MSLTVNNKMEGRLSRIRRMLAKYILVALFASVLLGCGCVVVAAAGEVGSITTADTQASYSLNNHWKFRPGDDLKWASADHYDGGWVERHLTKLWPLGGYSLPSTSIVCRSGVGPW